MTTSIREDTQPITTPIRERTPPRSAEKEAAPEPISSSTSVCRSCGSPLHYTCADLGMSPLANAYLKPSQLNAMEPFFPLHAYVCENCFLVQLEAFENPQNIFSDYAYFSSYSDTLLRHSKAYTDMIVARLGLTKQHEVVEIASNDGYLLQYFVEKGIPVLGVEPAANVAEAAVQKGIPTLVRFFGRETAQEMVSQGKQADLIVANNVLAHVPDVNSFVEGLKILLKPRGVMTLEFHYLLRLMADNLFDTIYHEHFSYFSFGAANKVFSRHGLTVFDVEELSTQGGSLRVYVCHEGDTTHTVSPRVDALLAKEESAGLTQLETYLAFAETIKRMKRKFLTFLIAAKQDGKTIAGYGAAAKGNTLLNYCGIGTDFVDYVADRSPHKQGLFLPGTHIPICAPDKVQETEPDYLLILPWNIKDEIMNQMAHVREWGGQFVVLIPEVETYS
jgi:SAM-dependent methyltransferase